MLRPLLDKFRYHRRTPGGFQLWWVVAGVVALVLLSLPFWGGRLVRSVAVDKVRERLGAEMTIGYSRLWYTRLVLDDVSIGEPGKAPVAVMGRIEVPVAAAWGGGTVHIERARFVLEHRGPDDNVSALIKKLRGRESKPATSGSEKRERKLPSVTIRSAQLRARDTRYGALVVDGLDLDLHPGKELVAETKASAGIVRLRGRDSDPKFGASRVRVVVPLEGLRPVPLPIFEVSGGYLQPLPDLGLTGITGSVRPAPEGGDGTGKPRPLIIAIDGSYGGSRETLWTASGQLEPPRDGVAPAASVSVRAERFSLERIKDVLPPTILNPSETSIDAALDLKLAQGKLGFRGKLDVAGLNLHHEGVSSEPVRGLALGLVLDGSLDPARRRLELAKLEGRTRGLTGILAGAVELREGKFKFTDGTELPMLPLIELSFRVPKIGCDKLIESIPPPIIPHLQGFQLKGVFEANVYTKIDYLDLEALELGGKVGIDGCKVLKAPEEVTALAGSDPITQLVEIPSADKNAPPGATELMAFTIGPDNPNFVPYDQISPYLVNSIMTTEDNGFFKHRGWVSPEFKTALRRNLQGGGFRLGASSITMQTVKNVLLSREKTLSRKLQELFLVWYIEQLLPKERILELYFNAIEFGPRLYGIGAATKHYFGKPPSALTPLEAAFFSSILPSPKRRYIQYCHGQLYPPWDKYVRRILTRIHERGRLTDDEFTIAAEQQLVFDLAGRGGTEAECLAWVKKITTPAPEPPP
ncbi:MAG TPA: biosynthetic peptidoglycan transglycosylase, partial [Polyangia bacterium]